MNRGLFIERLASVEQSLPWITEEERRAAEGFCAKRRREYFAWRALVRRKLGSVEIGYNAVGAPLLPEFPDLHISVSHGAEQVAVCISDRPCAVDIERADRYFGRILSRYLTPAEQSLSPDPRFAAVAWCAKECLYKLSGLQELNLLDDMRITDVGSDWIEGRIKIEKPVRLSFKYKDDAVVVWTV